MYVLTCFGFLSRFYYFNTSFEYHYIALKSQDLDDVSARNTTRATNNMQKLNSNPAGEEKCFQLAFENVN